MRSSGRSYSKSESESMTPHDIRPEKPASRLAPKANSFFWRTISVMASVKETHRARETSILDRVGRTPLIRLSKVESPVPLYAKAEWFNPGGSVKDRPVLAMVAEGERSGALFPGKTILDATSGNTGIGYAWIGAAKGYPVRLCLPQNASPERKKILRVLGADLLFTPAGEGIDRAIRKVREMIQEEPDRYFYPDQYSNPANWRAHYETTALEIWDQTRGKITHFVAGLGTSGTFVGTTRRLKEFNPGIRCISFQPDSPFHGLEGLKQMASSLVPAIYDPSVADENLEVSTEEAYRMVKRLAREEGLLVGISSGAALAVSLKVARKLKEGLIVTVFPDGADKYLSERFWDEEDEHGSRY